MRGTFSIGTITLRGYQPVLRLFFATFLVGLALTAVVAGVWPLPEHPRIRSQIDVIQGGGRQEEFVIRWPQDRIALPAGQTVGEPTGTTGTTVFRARDGEVASAELFRLRDVDGSVIGIASRMTARVTGQRVPTASASNWMLLIPSRGSLLLTQENSADVGPAWNADGGALYIAPAETASFWSRGERYRITAGPAREGQGKVVRGTEEFSGLVGTYTEIWELEEVAEDQTTKGRIVLTTVTRSGQ